jgi:hypothetical protein
MRLLFKIFILYRSLWFSSEERVNGFTSNSSSPMELLYNEAHKFTTAIIEKKNQLCYFETNVTVPYPKCIVDGMSSFNSLKHFLGYFVIHEVKVDCNRDQSFKMSSRGSLPPSAVSGHEA